MTAPDCSSPFSTNLETNYPLVFIKSRLQLISLAISLCNAISVIAPIFRTVLRFSSSSRSIFPLSRDVFISPAVLFSTSRSGGSEIFTGNFNRCVHFAGGCGIREEIVLHSPLPLIEKSVENCRKIGTGMKGKRGDTLKKTESGRKTMTKGRDKYVWRRGETDMKVV